VLVNNAAATFIAQTEHLSRGRRSDPGADAARHDVLHARAGRRWIDGKHKGVVLSILSTSTITGRAFTVPSAMAKSAVLAMTQASRWSGDRVCARSRSRRRVPTPGLRVSSAPRAAMGLGRNPLGRAATWRTCRPGEFLISDQAGYINGEMVVQDGGAHCAVPAPRICCNGPMRSGEAAQRRPG
jgi:hypothetical protein